MKGWLILSIGYVCCWLNMLKLVGLVVKFSVDFMIIEVKCWFLFGNFF